MIKIKWMQQDQVRAAGLGGSSRIRWEQQDQVGAAGPVESSRIWEGAQVQSSILIKKKRKFSSCTRKFRRDRVSDTRKGFLIFEEMRKYLVIYEEAVSQI